MTSLNQILSVAVFIPAIYAAACSGSDAAVTGGSSSISGVTLRLDDVVSGLQQPVYLTAPPGDNRLFIVEQAGRVRIVENGAVLPTPFLDIVSKVGCCIERGLLSIAFHPAYATNGFFFVSYTGTDGNSVIERYVVSANRSLANPSSAKVILTQTQPYANHNGGHILFGPDGMFYIAFGDGGSGGDPHGNGQNRNTLLGKLLRVDVNSGDPYSIPAGNPFVGQSGVRPEIWAYGLRNPWRNAFDRVADLLYVADVGQNQREEINVVPRASAGVNYGWNIMEGAGCYNSLTCNQSGLTLPIHQYNTSGGFCSVTGGYAYRGSAIPELQGHYFYSDYCKGGLRSFRYTGNGIADGQVWNVASTGTVSSFGEDASGELYVVSHSGTIRKIVRASP